jgi:hypothetical protein
VEHAVTAIPKAKNENHPVEDRAPDRTTTSLHIETPEQVPVHIKKRSLILKEKRGTRGSRFEGFQFFFTEAINSSMEIAAILMILMVPLKPSSMDTFAIVSLSGASTIFTKS